MHPLNRYGKAKPDFAELAAKYPSFAPYVTTLPTGTSHIDFKDPAALRSLTTVLLKKDWDLNVELREDRLCPTVSNRLEYVLHILDLEGYLEPGILESGRDQEPSSGGSARDRTTTILDIGTGHVAIYPLLIHRLRPNARVYATESDQTSNDHSVKTLSANKIPSDKVQLFKAYLTEPILFPLKDCSVDIVMCNPPFYGSLQELEDGSGRKVQAPFAAPTAAHNELITRGGEVAFVGQMITESLEFRDKCKWFTSLIGIYASLQPLVDQLRSLKIDNYFIKVIKPSHTTRWVLGWSFGKIRLPDSLTRPEALIAGTSYTKLLSHANVLRHTPLHPPLSLEQLRGAVIPVLKSIKLLEDTDAANIHSDKEIILKPKSNTWSRAARRAAARGEQSTESNMPIEPSSVSAQDALFVARLSFLPPIPPSETKPEAQFDEASTIENAYKARSTDQKLGGKGDWRGATLVVHFEAGDDRDSFDAFWKFLLNKAGLLGSNTSTPRDDDDKGETKENPYIETGGKKRGRDDRGVRGGRRGRGRVKMF